MNLISGDHRAPWLTHLPVRWDNKPLKYVATINRMALPESTPEDQLIRYIDISSVNSLGQVVNIESMAFRSAPSRARRVARHGDTIVSTVRTYLRAVASIPEDDSDLVASTGFAVVTPGPDLHAGFLSHWLRGNLFVDEVCARSVGVSYPATNASEVGCIPVPLPSLPTQKAIADFLDTKTAAIDALIEKKQKLLTLLAEKRAALINQAVTKGLDPNVPMKDSGIPWIGEIPAHWEISRVKFEMDNLNYRRIPLSAEERGERSGKYPYYGASNVIDYVDDYLFDETSILIAEDGANLVLRNLPLAIIAEGKYWVNNHAHILRPRDRAFRFWAPLLEALDYRPFISGSAQPKLTAEAIGNVEVGVPPTVGERRAIAERVSSVESELTAPASRLAIQVEKLREYRQALITAAVTGQLDIGEAA